MKTLLIRLSISTRGLSVLLTLSLLSLVLLHLSGFKAAEVAEDTGDEFPGGRQGGGTHWVIPAMKTASIDKAQWDC